MLQPYGTYVCDTGPQNLYYNPHVQYWMMLLQVRKASSTKGVNSWKVGAAVSTSKTKFSKIYLCVSKAPLNSLQLHPLSNETSESKNGCAKGKGFIFYGNLLKNASWQILTILTGYPSVPPAVGGLMREERQ